MTSRRGKKLPRTFFRRPTLEVAPDLIGKILRLHRNGIELSGRIVETEAYIGEDDPACHARFGRTERNSIMYGDAGFAYVYFIYGMYDMLNFVTEPKGHPAAVLIRALEPLEGIVQMKKLRGTHNELNLTNGPGKLCQAFGITTGDTGHDLLSQDFHLIDDGRPPAQITSTARIGIRQGTEIPWRFLDPASRHISIKHLPKLA